MTICDNMTICRNRVLPNASVDGSPAKKGCGRRRRRQIGKILNPWFGAHSGDIFLGKTEKFSRATFFGGISLRKTEKISRATFFGDISLRKIQNFSRATFFLLLINYFEMLYSQLRYDLTVFFKFVSSPVRYPRDIFFAHQIFWACPPPPNRPARSATAVT